ncbi:unnamed protein product [Effrenium voratum]|nr:unnamed protein product [Effrenium voratum]
MRTVLICKDHGEQRQDNLPEREHWEAQPSWSCPAACFAWFEVKADVRCVEIAVNQTWKALEYASDGIRDDPVVVLPVVKSCWWALEFVGESARGDDEVAIEFLARLSVPGPLTCQNKHAAFDRRLCSKTFMRLSAAPSRAAEGFKV